MSPAKDFVPGRVLGPNVHGTILYLLDLLAAQKHRAEARDIEPVWRDFLQAFPRKLAAKTLTWPDLAWAARAYYCGFCGAESSQVLPSLYNDVQELMQ